MTRKSREFESHPLRHFPPRPVKNLKWRSTQVGRRGRFAKPLGRVFPAQGFESLLLRHVAASCISLAAIFLQKSPARSFRYVSSFAKSHARFACSVVNALTTAHSRYQLFASYEGSNPTAKNPKISFLCASHISSILDFVWTKSSIALYL